MTYGDLGDRIFKKYRENEISQAVHRIRPVQKDESEVHFFTGVIPDGIPVHVDESEDGPEDADELMKRALANCPGHSARTETIAELTGYSTRHVRRVLDEDEDVTDVCESEGRHVWKLRRNISLINKEHVRSFLREHNFDLKAGISELLSGSTLTEQESLDKFVQNRRSKPVDGVSLTHEEVSKIAREAG